MRSNYHFYVIFFFRDYDEPFYKQKLIKKKTLLLNRLSIYHCISFIAAKSVNYFRFTRHAHCSITRDYIGITDSRFFF